MTACFGIDSGLATKRVIRSRAGRPAALLFGVLALCSVVATSGAAAEAGCPNEVLRSELSSSSMPDCRAYEMVSPSYKEGYPPLASSFAADGASAIINTQAALAQNPGSGETIFPQGSVYLDTRTPIGWRLTPLNPSPTEFIGQIPLAAEATDGETLWEQHTPEQSPSHRDLYVRAPGPVSDFSLIGPLTPHENPEEEAGNVIVGAFRFFDEPRAATHDYTHIVLEAVNPGDRWQFDATEGETHSLYEYSGLGNSQPILVGVTGPEHGSRKLIATCGTTLGSGGAGSTYNALSHDGEVIFFTVNPCGGKPATTEIYARRHGAKTSPVPAETVDISSSQCTEACGAAQSGKNFEGASEDGSLAFFTSTQKLTNDAVDGIESGNAAEGRGCARIKSANGCNLYLYESTNERLKEVSIGGDVLGVVGIAEDGAHVYYVSRAEIQSARENPYRRTPVPGQPNLYVYDVVSGTTSYIATLGSENEDKKDWLREYRRSAEVAGANGRFLLFASAAPDVTPDDRSTQTQLFEYKAEEQGSAAELVRVTQGEDGFAEDGNGVSAGVELSSIATVAERLGHGADFKSEGNELNVSADGSTVFFETTGNLSPRATSASKGCTSLYEFHAIGSVLGQGAVRLLSDGRDVQLYKGATCGAGFQYADLSGRNVLFATADPLLSSDVDGVQRDLYDAREYGGFAQAQLGGACGAGFCEGTASSQATLPIASGSGGEAPSVMPSAIAKGKTQPKVKSRIKTRSCRSKSARCKKLKRAAERKRRQGKKG